MLLRQCACGNEIAEKGPSTKHCSSCYMKKYRARPDVKAYYEQRRQRISDEKRKYIEELLLRTPCMDCGESNPMVLEFDHVRGEKKSEVGSLIYNGFLLKALKEEIEKCDIVCANCHRKRTYKRANSWRYTRFKDYAS